MSSQRNIPVSSSRKSPSNLETRKPDRVKQTGAPPDSSCALTSSMSLSTSAMCPSNEKFTHHAPNSTRTEASLVFSFMRASIACSADEILFVKLVQDYGLREAMRIAARFDLRCLRPLHVLLAKSRILDKNYTSQSANRRLLFKFSSFFEKALVSRVNHLGKSRTKYHIVRRVPLPHPRWSATSPCPQQARDLARFSTDRVLESYGVTRRRARLRVRVRAQ